MIAPIKYTTNILLSLVITGDTTCWVCFPCPFSWTLRLTLAMVIRCWCRKMQLFFFSGSQSTRSAILQRRQPRHHPSRQRPQWLPAQQVMQDWFHLRRAFFCWTLKMHLASLPRVVGKSGNKIGWICHDEVGSLATGWLWHDSLPALAGWVNYRR